MRNSGHTNEMVVGRSIYCAIMTTVMGTMMMMVAVVSAYLTTYELELRYHVACPAALSSSDVKWTQIFWPERYAV